MKIVRTLVGAIALFLAWAAEARYRSRRPPDRPDPGIHPGGGPAEPRLAEPRLAGPGLALRRSSRPIVEGCRPNWRAISARLQPAAHPSAISPRSTNDRYRPDPPSTSSGTIPPDSAIHRRPVVADTPTNAAASACDSPANRARQNTRTRSRPALGRPGITTPHLKQDVATAP